MKLLKLYVLDDKRTIRNKVTVIKRKSHFLSGFYYLNFIFTIRMKGQNLQKLDIILVPYLFRIKV